MGSLERSDIVGNVYKPSPKVLRDVADHLFENVQGHFDSTDMLADFEVALSDFAETKNAQALLDAQMFLCSVATILFQQHKITKEEMRARYREIGLTEDQVHRQLNDGAPLN